MQEKIPFAFFVSNGKDRQGRPVKYERLPLFSAIIGQGDGLCVEFLCHLPLLLWGDDLESPLFQLVKHRNDFDRVQCVLGFFFHV